MVRLKTWAVQSPTRSIKLEFEGDLEACENVLDALETRDGKKRTMEVVMMLFSHVQDVDPDEWYAELAARMKDRSPA